MRVLVVDTRENLDAVLHVATGPGRSAQAASLKHLVMIDALAADASRVDAARKAGIQIHRFDDVLVLSLSYILSVSCYYFRLRLLAFSVGI